MRNNTATPPAAYSAHSIILTSRPSKSTSSISCPSAGFSKGSTARAGGGANIKKNTARPNITNSRIDIFCFILLGGVGGDDPLDRTNYCIRKQADREANERPLQAFLGFFHGLFVPAGNDISESIIYNKQDRRNSGDLQEPAHYADQHGLEIVPLAKRRRELIRPFVRRGKTQKLGRAGNDDKSEERDYESADSPLQTALGFFYGLLVATRDDQLEPAEHHKGYPSSADERGKSLHGFLYHGTRFSQTAQRVVERNRAGETRGEGERENQHGLDDKQYQKDFLHISYKAQPGVVVRFCRQAGSYQFRVPPLPKIPLTTKFTKTKDKATMAKPTTALLRPFFAFSIRSGLPRAVMRKNPDTNT